jgi:hypothetical protein
MITEMDANALAFYGRHGPITDPGPHANLLAALPAGVESLVRVVQGLVVHIFWAERYGLRLSQEREGEVGLRRVEAQIERILDLDARPLSEARPLERRLVGNCRDFSILLCAMLRAHGIPARARCGFGAYFWPGRYEDHWVCEVWQAERERWVLVDAQLDAFQQDVLQPDFSPLDVPRNRFIVGGQAWLDCREGRSDPLLYGIHDMHGMWFIRGNVVRDMLALNKIELLPWDDWGPMVSTETEALTRNVALIDRLARLSLAGDELFLALRATYESERRLYGVPVQVLEQALVG